jgi:hypothetical protein
MPLDSNRIHYRITYPIAARPTFDWNGRPYEVLDVSEHGIRFLSREGNSAKPGAAVKGVLRFQSGHSAHVDGAVLRSVDGHASIQLNIDLPYRLIMEQQVYLQKRFPALR